ncbi:glycoside hydrolase family 95 protein [Novosphingobium mathurense]|nr:glycoside hydrolase family 95 protein [Novosphingobium mathurense]
MTVPVGNPANPLGHPSGSARDHFALTRRKLLTGIATMSAAVALGEFGSSSTAGAAPMPLSRDRLWYRQPAHEWIEALPVGNGRIGAMVFGGTGLERLQLNEDTLWTGGPYNPVNPAAHAVLPQIRQLIEQGRFTQAQALANERLMARPLSQMAYQTFGNLTIAMPSLGAVEQGSYLRELDLDAALATTTFQADGVSWSREVVASPDHQVIAIRLWADQPGRIHCLVGLEAPHDSALTIDGDTLILSGRNNGAHGVEGALRFEARARILHHGGGHSVSDGKLAVEGADTVTILIAMATSYRGFDDVSGDPSQITRGQIEAASRHSFARIAADTAASHRKLYRRVALDLGETPEAHRPTDERIRTSQTSDDSALAALYFQYGRYLLICSSRPGSQPANLQGIWNDSDDPPWGSKYTININTEMNYWPAEPSGLGECVAPLVSLVRDLAQTGARTAREMYGARGWVAHHNTDLWRATAPIDGAAWGLWPMGGAWLCTHLWGHFDYHRDTEFLRSIYPLMRGAALFFLDTLQRDPATGFLVTNPSISPENEHPGGASVCAGPAVDRQILRDLLAQTAKAATILGVDRELSAQMLDARSRLAPDRIGSQGQLQEWLEDWDADAPEPHHRHVSHLYGLYPSHQINLDETPALAMAARKSLELRGDESTGWATAWRANLWARLREGDHAHRILRYLLGPERTYPNMFDAHPPFQIDGNFGGAAAIAEMLVQSRDDEIRLLPALPRAWPQGSARGLRTRGACEVSLGWRGGELISARLVGRTAGKRIVRLNDRSAEVELIPGRPVTLNGPSLRTSPLVTSAE